MTLKDILKKLTTPVAELDEAQLRELCAVRPGVTPIVDVVARQEATVIGEISSVRVVPQPDGSPWLEATVTDGTGALVAMWTGRKRIAGVRPGQRLVLAGRGAPTAPNGRLMLYNPIYELL